MAARKSRNAVADFEKQFSDLEKIVARMETGEQSLDESLSDFEKGMALCRSLREALAEAEQKVQVLVRQGDAEKLEPFEPPTEPDAE